MSARDRLRQPLPPMPPGARLLGVDFTSAPGRRKPITVARGVRRGDTIVLHGVAELPDFAGFEALLAEPGPWLGGFDFPFGLPRPFADDVAPGADAAGLAQALRARCATRRDFQALVDAWGNRRPAGQRLIHRRCDTAEPGVSSSSPLQTRYVPVGYMYFEGLPRLLAAGLTLPGLHAGDPQRVALEAYPGLLAHELIGRRSYKNTDDAARRAARADVVQALRAGRTRLGLALALEPGQEAGLVDDPAGDRLDAVLCLVQAAWAAARPGWGLPDGVDPVEGWITSAGAAR